MLFFGFLKRESAHYTQYHINNKYISLKRPDFCSSSWPLLAPILKFAFWVINDSDWSVSDTTAPLSFQQSHAVIIWPFARANIPCPHTPQCTSDPFWFYHITGNRHRTQCWNWNSGQHEDQCSLSISETVLFCSLATFVHLSDD